MDAQVTSSPGRNPIGDHLQRRLSEAWQSLWDTFVDPRESYWDDGADWVAAGGALPGGGVSTKCPFGNEQQLQEIRDQCRALAAGNEFAINGHENRISYLVGAGHTYRAAARKGLDVPPELCRLAQQVVDQFIAANQWHRRQQEIVRRCDRDGETFLRFFVGDDGQTRVRFIEPSQVATPTVRASDPGGQLWHPHRAGRRRNAAGLLCRRIGGRCR